jgi:hypothetical protein
MESPDTVEDIRIELNYDSRVRTAAYESLIGPLVDYMDNHVYKHDYSSINYATKFIHKLLMSKRQSSKFIIISKKESELLSVAIDFIQDINLKQMWENVLLVSLLNHSQQKRQPGS